MSKTADKLIILLDIGYGLMGRLYNLYNFEKPNHLNIPELSKINIHLIKKFPEYPDNVEKIYGWEIFQKKSLELVPILRDYYLTFLDIIEWRSNAWAVLEEIAKTCIDLQFHLNQTLTINFFELMVQYFQLHVMIEKIPEKKLLLTVYARAHHCIESNSEPNFSRIAIFVNEFNETPIKKLQEDFVPIAARIADSLIPLYSMISKWSNPKSIRDAKVFDLIEKIDESNKTGNLESYTELMYLENIKRWVLIGFLVSPSQIQREGALALLQVALSDTWVVPIFRDQFIEIHTQYRELYTVYKNGKWIFNDDANKDYIKHGVNAAVGNSGLAHAQARTQLRWYLKQLVLMTEAHGGICAPKFAMILAMLSLAKSELYWYFLHHTYFAHPSFVMPKNKAQYVQNHYQDDYISELIYLVDRVLVGVNQPDVLKSIHDYYCEMLTLYEIAPLKAVAESLTNHPKLSVNVKLSFEYILELLSNFNENTLQDDPDVLETVRMTFHRAFLMLSIALNSKDLKNACTPCNSVFMHTKFMDQGSQLLSQFGSMKLLWFFNAHGHNKYALLDQIFEKALHGRNGQPGNIMAFIRLLSTSMENVHRYCPEEQKSIGMHAMRIAQNYLRLVTNAIDDNILVILRSEFQLYFKCSPHAIVEKMQGKTKSAPGSESEYDNAAEIAEMRNSRKIVSEICSALRLNPTIIVYDHEYCPYEFIIEKIMGSIRNHFKRLVMPYPQSGMIEQPSNMVQKLKIIATTYNLVSQHIAIDIHDIVKQTLLLEFNDAWNGGGLGENLPEMIAPAVKSTGGTSADDDFISGMFKNFMSQPESREDKDGDKAKELNVASSSASPAPKSDNSISIISSFYKRLFTFFLSSHGVYYSNYSHCFVAKEFVNTKTGEVEKFMETERYTDPTELEALITIIGPNGARCIERELLGSITRHVAVIKDFLVKVGKPSWETLSSRYAEENVWRESIASMSAPDLNRAVQYAITVGCILRFRCDMRDALQRTVRNASNHLYNFLEELNDRTGSLSLLEWFGEKTVPRSIMIAIEQLCADAGIVGLVDSRFRVALYKLMSTNSPNFEFFHYLPELIGCFFASDEFRAANMMYWVAEDGYRNNCHMIAEAAVELIKVHTVFSHAAPFLHSSAAAETSAVGADGKTRVVASSVAVRDTEQKVDALSDEELTRMHGEHDKIVKDLKGEIVLNLQKLIRCVALAMLTIKPSPDSQPNSHQLLAMPVLESFVKATNGLVHHSFLEQFLPSAVVRHNFVVLSTIQLNKELASNSYTNNDFEERKDFSNL